LKAQSYQETEKRHLKASSTQSLLLDEETIMIVENCGECGYENWHSVGATGSKHDKIVGFFREAEVAQ
jgi:Zn ribbon nucleic-acid-binding protein